MGTEKGGKKTNRFNGFDRDSLEKFFMAWRSHNTGDQKTVMMKKSEKEYETDSHQHSPQLNCSGSQGTGKHSKQSAASVCRASKCTTKNFS